MHWAAPFLIVGYFLLSYIVQKFLMSPVVHYVYKQERLEGLGTVSSRSLRDALLGEFRRIHSIQNQFSEAIAFSRGERVEAELTRRTFARLMANSSNIVKWEAFLYCPHLIFASLSWVILTVISSFLRFFVFGRAHGLRGRSLAIAHWPRWCAR